MLKYRNPIVKKHNPNKFRRRKANGFERKMYQLLEDDKIRYFKEYRIPKTTKFYDVYLPDMKLLIEFDGDYYHKTQYNECRNDMQKKNYFNDKEKDVLAAKNGYKLIRITETESKDIVSIKKLIIEKLTYIS